MNIAVSLRNVSVIFGRKPQEISYTDAAGKQHTATAFSWEKTDKAEELRKAAKL